MTLRRAALIIWRRKLSVVAIVLAAAAIGAVTASRLPRAYQSQASVTLFPLTAADGAAPSDAQTYATHIDYLLGNYSSQGLPALAGAAATQLKITQAQVLSDVSVSPVANTSVLTVTAVAPTSSLAAAETRVVAPLLSQWQNSVNAQVTNNSGTATRVRTTQEFVFGGFLLAGILIAVLGALLWHMFFGGLDDTGELAAALPDTPVLGAMPRARGLRRGPRLAADEPDLRSVDEATRVIRTNLMHAARGSALRSLAVVSDVPREGRTMLAVNLAAAFADLDTRVALVDADVASPSLHDVFELDNERGLIDLTAPGTSPAALLQKTSYPGVSLLPAGLGPIGEQESASLFRAAPKWFGDTADLVIFDTPALSDSTEVRLLASAVSGVVVVASAGFTRGRDVQRLVEDLQAAGATVYGAVLMRARYRSVQQPIRPVATAATADPLGAQRPQPA